MKKFKELKETTKKIGESIEQAQKDIKEGKSITEVGKRLVKVKETADANAIQAQQWLESQEEYNTKQKRAEITQLDISNRNLEGHLDLSDFVNLEDLNCGNNQLTSLNLEKNKKLKELWVINNNFSKQDLSFLSHLVNLRWLELGSKGNPSKVKEGIYNRFCGSLEPLKNMTELSVVNINDTDIDSGLEYLPENLAKLTYSTENRPDTKVNKIDEELFFYKGNLKAWKEAHPELMIKAWGKKINNTYQNKSSKVISTNLSELSKEEWKIDAKENPELETAVYQEFVLRDGRPFSWETSQDKPLAWEKIPIKLYNIKSRQVEETRGRSDIKSYATLSYVWGDMKESEKKKQVYKKVNGEVEEKEVVITKWGTKTLEKAIKTCEYLNIGYLWMDQLCIDQNSLEEKNQEVPKMGKYYYNSEATLVAIQTKTSDEDITKESKKKLSQAILKKIVNSQWFSRSWTFQEGWLSKHTIFMFDDALVDGRILAQIWVSVYHKTTFNPLNDNPWVFITPLGWTYFVNEEQTILGLPEALTAVKNRGRGVVIDGIYSILGLLSYGHKVKPKYKKWGEIYTKKELEEALMDVMKVAVQEGYIEPLAWYGARRNEPHLWWIPEIDENNSFLVQGGVDISRGPGRIKLTENGVKLTGFRYMVNGIGTRTEEDGKTKWDGYNIIAIEGETGSLTLGIAEDGNNNSSWNSTQLRGSVKILEKIKVNDILVISKIKSNGGAYFEEGPRVAFLIPSEDNFDCPLSVFGESSGIGRDEIEGEELFIDMVNKKVIEGTEEIKEYQAQIQAPLKGNN